MTSATFKRLKPLAGGGGGASVELVEVDGRQLVLKRQTPRHISAEKRFQRALRAADLPSLEVVDHPLLQPNEILLEYIEGAPTVGGARSIAVFERWGAAIGALHAIGSARFVELDATDRLIEASWPDYIDAVVQNGLSRQRNDPNGLPAALLDRIEEALASLAQYRPRGFALAHGDLHANNALLRDGEVVLFDKGLGVWVGPPVLDLAVIYSEGFPGARYVESSARSEDTERLDAFMAGYGGLPEDQASWIDHFVLVRSLRRYPNPFVLDLLSTIEVALERCEGKVVGRRAL